MDIESKARKYDQKIIWSMVFMCVFILGGFAVGTSFIVTGKVARSTLIFTFVFFLLGGIGLGPGAHKLFSHRAYKVTRGLKIFIILCHQLSGMKSVITWVRIHRTHHKFVETDRDPTNIHRGLFWACVGCGLTTLPPECDQEMERIHMDDLYADNDIVFEYNYYPLLYAAITHGLPTLIPYIFWNELLHIAFVMNVFRLGLHVFQTFIGQGLLHYNGRKPYDKNATAIDNVAYNLLLLGEGNHNFHHTFPFDYRSNDIKNFKYFTSPASFFIDFFAFFGLVTDRKVAPAQMIARRVARTGDGSHPYLKELLDEKTLWGYGDTDMKEEDKHLIDIDGNRKTVSKMC